MRETTKVDAMDPEDMARLRVVIIRLARQFNATATGEGLTPTQASVLGLIAHRGPLGLAELAELEGLESDPVSRVVRKLDEDGLIRRHPDPPTCARPGQITPEGTTVNEHIRALRTRRLRMHGAPPHRTAEQLLQALPAMEGLQTSSNPPAPMRSGIPRTKRPLP